jgi:hypothetical protein
VTPEVAGNAVKNFRFIHVHGVLAPVPEQSSTRGTGARTSPDTSGADASASPARALNGIRKIRTRPVFWNELSETSRIASSRVPEHGIPREKCRR